MESGKSGTPLSRTHWANLRAASCCWELLVVPVNPGGSSLLHALMACWNATLLVSTPEPFAIASIVNWPDGPGSGNLLTPFERMHRANCTAFSRLVAVLLAPALPVPAELLFVAGAWEQLAPIRVIKATAASGRSLLLAAGGFDGRGDEHRRNDDGRSRAATACAGPL